jgi:hypothetical protein
MIRRGLRSKAIAGAVSVLAVTSLTTGCTDNGVGGLYGGDEEQSEENGDDAGEENGEE